MWTPESAAVQPGSTRAKVKFGSLILLSGLLCVAVLLMEQEPSSSFVHEVAPSHADTPVAEFTEDMEFSADAVIAEKEEEEKVTVAGITEEQDIRVPFPGQSNKKTAANAKAASGKAEWGTLAAAKKKAKKKEVGDGFGTIIGAEAFTGKVSPCTTEQIDKKHQLLKAGLDPAGKDGPECFEQEEKDSDKAAKMTELTGKPLKAAAYVAMDGCTTEAKWAKTHNEARNRGRRCLLGSSDKDGVVRCCSQDGKTCTSKNAAGICHGAKKTWDQAADICVKQGMRLCSQEEVHSQVCCNSGCSGDVERMWTLTTCTGRGVATPATPTTRQWTQVFDETNCKVAVNLGKAKTDAGFAKGSMFKYLISGKVYAVYKRLTSVPAHVSIYNLMTHTWSIKSGNKFNVDFKLYGSVKDAEAGNNAWKACNGDDNGVGFPRDCGPTGHIGGKWMSHNDRRKCGSQRTVSFWVHKTASTASSPPPTPTTPKKKAAGAVNVNSKVFDFKKSFDYQWCGYQYRHGHISMRKSLTECDFPVPDCPTKCGMGKQECHGRRFCQTIDTQEEVDEKLCDFPKPPAPLKVCPETPPCVKFTAKSPAQLGKRCSTACSTKPRTIWGKSYCHEIKTGKEVPDKTCEYWTHTKPRVPSQRCPRTPSCYQWKPEMDASACPKSAPCDSPGSSVTGTVKCVRKQGQSTVSNSACQRDNSNGFPGLTKPSAPSQTCPGGLECCRFGDNSGYLPTKTYCDNGVVSVGPGRRRRVSEVHANGGCEQVVIYDDDGYMAEQRVKYGAFSYKLPFDLTNDVKQYHVQPKDGHTC